MLRFFVLEGCTFPTDDFLSLWNAGKPPRNCNRFSTTSLVREGHRSDESLTSRQAVLPSFSSRNERASAAPTSFRRPNLILWRGYSPRDIHYKDVLGDEEKDLVTGLENPERDYVSGIDGDKILSRLDTLDRKSAYDERSRPGFAKPAF